jgi:large subunit ribosomal protein L30
VADMIKVRLVGSVISTTQRVRETVRGLGLHKIGSESTIKRSPQVEGMIRRLKHLVVEVKE